MGHIGFSWVGLLFLAMLMLPNLLWTKNQPEGYSSEGESKILVFLERAGEISAVCTLLVFSDLNPRREAGLWNLWLAAAGVFMVLYECWWIRYFHSGKHLEDFYSPFLGIPVAGASLPVAALLLLGIYSKVFWVLLAAVILAPGHIGVHLQHAKKLKTSR